VEPVTAAAAGLGGHVTETTVGLAVNKDKMLEAYETGDKAGKLSMLNKGTLTGCRI
jgi:acyl CoA:acetate/3-ketoacid CoA transferase alpha subunit